MTKQSRQEKKNRLLDLIKSRKVYLYTTLANYLLMATLSFTIFEDLYTSVNAIILPTILFVIFFIILKRNSLYYWYISLTLIFMGSYLNVFGFYHIVYTMLTVPILTIVGYVLMVPLGLIWLVNFYILITVAIETNAFRDIDDGVSSIARKKFLRTNAMMSYGDKTQREFWQVEEETRENEKNMLKYRKHSSIVVILLIIYTVVYLILVLNLY